MLKVSIILFVTALFFLVIYAVSSSKSKQRKNKKKAPRLTGVIAALCLTCSVILCVIYLKEKNIKIFNRLNSYDLPEKYTSTLASDGADKAYSLLPINVFIQNNDIYFINSENDCFLKSQTENIFKTILNDTSYIGGEKTLKTTLKTDGDLVLDGFFLFSKYDEEYLEYSNKVIADNVRSCSCSDNSLFYITNDNKLYAMGFNEYGQLCDTTVKNKTSPVFIMDNVQAADISDTHAMIVDKFGTLYASGDNSYSQLGNKTAISTTELTKVMQGVKDVKVGNYFSLVLTVNGELYTAGINDKGQLGNNGEEFKAQLVQILSGVEKIAINGNTCAALTYSGELYVWGDNTACKAGVVQDDIIYSPLKIQENVYDFALGSFGVVVLNKDRNILLSAQDGSFSAVIDFAAQIPEELKDKNDFYAFESPDKV